MIGATALVTFSVAGPLQTGSECETGGYLVVELAPPPEGIVVDHFIVSNDIERCRRSYTAVPGGRLAYSGPGGLGYVALSNSWIIINVGDRREAGSHTRGATRPRPGQQLLQHSRQRCRGRACRMERPRCQFLTAPKQRQYEIRCCIRDPDGHLISLAKPEGMPTPGTVAA
jgi:catechol 2,3-dioxygenase-like lactoylglutathione lyase family enzyme